MQSQGGTLPPGSSVAFNGAIGNHGVQLVEFVLIFYRRDDVLVRDILYNLVDSNALRGGRGEVTK